MPGSVFRLYVCEAGEESDDKEKNQRIGKSEQEACYHVAPIAVGIDLCGAKGACGVLAEKIYAKSHQYNASDNLDGELVGIDEPGNEAQAETGEQAVHQVAGSGTYPGEKSRPATLTQSTLNNKHADRTHRRRNERTYGDSSWQNVYQLFHRFLITNKSNQTRARLQIFPSANCQV